MPPKIKDIASYLNVSPATVSMALNNRPGVKEETRQEVLAAARKLAYQMTSAKRAVLETKGVLPLILYKKHGHVIGETPFFTSLIEAIKLEATKRGFRLNMYYVNATDKSSAEELKHIVQTSVSGVLILATEMETDDFEEIGEDFSKVVFIDNAVPGIQANKVLINNFDGAYQAVETLKKYGHECIGYLHSKVRINNFDERYAGFCRAVQEHSLTCQLSSDVFLLDSTHEGAYRDMCEYLSHDDMDIPSALFADNDIIAMGAIRALKEHGIKIPEEVSIIGFDDMPFCTLVEPNLSTIRVDRENIGRTAVRLLLEENVFLQKIEIGTSFISRNSVQKLK
ncbi:LacI family DNA-binding transcriptional regulator [Marispirochaeta aestuarii]|uniref:LacI family DNA-binding transcriptional regulator n=1 Tax=Marispirochaeta aestuarii TaxID=1963862 RepID=UPI0029C6B9A1|nr:LacI family DNA-binding transcriptional regulator [Marispirochaeta aestuarii]